MQQKLFYIPGYNALVFCHTDTGSELILGGLNKFFADTETDNSRQSISKEKFMKHEPVELNEDLISEYYFLEYAKNEQDYQVKDYKVRFYLEDAQALPSAPFKKQVFTSEKMPEKTKTGQGELF